jgi:hypothetical protein
MPESRYELQSDVDTAALREEIQELKDGVNSSFEEVANMFLELQAGLAQINERFDLYNRKASHKI